MNINEEQNCLNKVTFTRETKTITNRLENNAVYCIP